MTEQTKNRLMALGWGFGGMASALILCGILVFGVVVWQRAASGQNAAQRLPKDFEQQLKDGEQAYQFIVQVQAQQRASSPPVAGK